MYSENDYRSRERSRDKRKKEDLKKRVFRKKFCRFCLDKVKAIDYKDTQRLAKFVTERGKMIPSRISGNCAPHQRMIARAIKRSRQAALLPFITE